MTAALSLLGALCLACVRVAGSDVWGERGSTTGGVVGETVGGKGRAMDNVIVGHSVGGVEG